MAITPEVLHSHLKSDLLSQGLPIHGEFFPEMNLREAFAVSLQQSLTKKFVSSVAGDANKKALDKFLASNHACSEWNYGYDQESFLQMNGFRIDTKTEVLLGELKRAVDDFWFHDGPTKRGRPLVDHPFDILVRARVGPGANRLANGGDFYTKLFSSRLSCSSQSLYFWYKRYTQRWPEWSNAENIREQHFGSPSVASSKLSFVPKNDRISRCICIEPTLNTFFQLGFGHILESRLKGRFGIDLSDQQFKNRDLARLGSLTDNLSTIDLSSASDSISLKMLRWLLPSDFYSQLVKYRTPSVDVDGVGTVPLHMVSTMGNGFTFPLQTMVFACVVIACLRFRDLPLDRTTSENLWGVFGDDIICPRLITSDVIHLLALLGFKVNDDKTFVEGPFRESCGSDFFKGSDIRGVYIKKLDDHASLYTALNLLVRFSTRSGIYLSHLVGYLQSKVPRSFVPRYEDLSAGIHAPKAIEDVRKYGRSRDTQGTSYMCLVPRQSACVISEKAWIIYTPGRVKKRIYNHSGLFISFLQGSVKSSKILLREERVRWRLKRRATSLWDGLPASSLVRDHFDYSLDWQRWEIVAYTYFER